MIILSGDLKTQKSTGCQMEIHFSIQIIKFLMKYKLLNMKYKLFNK